MISMMKRSMIVALLILALIPAMNLAAKELVLEPKKAVTIVSPTDARDSRILVCFELPKALQGPKVEIDNAALMITAGVEGVDVGMLNVFPVAKDWSAAAEVSWASPWDSPGGDYSTKSLGRGVTLRRAQGKKEISSNALFLVKSWLNGSLPNNGIIIVPSEADLAESAAEFSVEKASMKLVIFYRD
jgi:hypothetical protein